MPETLTWPLCGIKAYAQFSDTRELDKDQIINFFSFPLSYLKFWRRELYPSCIRADTHIDANETTFIYNVDICCALAEEFAFMLNRKCSPIRRTCLALSSISLRSFSWLGSI